MNYQIILFNIKTNILNPKLGDLLLKCYFINMVNQLKDLSVKDNDIYFTF